MSVKARLKIAMVVIVRALVGGVVMLLLLGPAQALDPARSMAQFHHTTWTLHDGMPPNANAIAQTPDGFLWLATDAGLYRFDGVRAEQVGADRLPPSPASALAATADGDLWVGFSFAKIARVRHGLVETFDLPVTGYKTPVRNIIPDSNGSVWVSTQDAVLNFDGQRWRVIASPWPPAVTYVDPGGVWGLALARDGTVWSKNLLGLYYLRRGAHTFEQAPGYAGSIIDFARERDGRLWTADSASRRFYALPDLPLGQPVPQPEFGAAVPSAILGAVRLDRDGALWNANRVTFGLYRIGSLTTPTALDRFTTVQGLTSEGISSVFEDREGDIWLGTALGLERFSPADIVVEPSMQVRQQAVQLLANSSTLFCYTGMGAPAPDPKDPGRRLFRSRADRPPELVASDLGQWQASAMMSNGAIVYAADGKLLRWRDGVVTAVATPPALEGAHVANIASAGEDLWVSAYGKGVYRLDAGRWAPVTPPSEPAGAAPSIAIDSAGSAWLFYDDNIVVRVNGDQTTTFHAEIGFVRASLPDGGGLIVVGDQGIARFDGHSLQSIPASRAPAIAMATGIAQASDGDIWLASRAGILQIKRPALLKALADPRAPLDFRLFDKSDGFTVAAGADVFNNEMVAGPDGRIWFLMGTGVAWIDPHHLYRDTEPPPVVVTSVTANGRSYDTPDNLSLAADTSQLQIDYTALSLAAPERVRFRYRLAGVDKDWVEAGGRRQAFYTNLQPGEYHFQVIAANNDGVWNATGSTITFSVQPTFWQTWQFKVLIGLLALAGLWLAYRIRVLQVSERIRARLAERMDERERIARELHDTLLQAIQGLTLKLQSFAEQMPAELPARKLMEQAMDRTGEVLADGRDRVRNLRVNRASSELSDALAADMERLKLHPPIETKIHVEGIRRLLHPVVFEEAIGVACEALFNAFTHSQANLIVVEVEYKRSRLTVRVRDDGVGIDGQVLEHGREGHFGLSGMRERARKIRGQLTIHSRPGSTEIALVVPASYAYARRSRNWLPFGAAPFEFED